jgi:hypothetical protein
VRTERDYYDVLARLEAAERERDELKERQRETVREWGAKLAITIEALEQVQTLQAYAWLDDVLTKVRP